MCGSQELFACQCTGTYHHMYIHVHTHVCMYIHVREHVLTHVHINHIYVLLYGEEFCRVHTYMRILTIFMHVHVHVHAMLMVS